MHPLNDTLSNAEKIGVPNDEKKSLEDIVSCIDSIERVLSRNEIVYNKTVSRFIRLVNTHKTLKYDLEPGFRGTIATLFVKIYETNKISAPLKIRILSVLKTLCKKSSGHMPTFSFHWKLFWNEILSIVRRDNREEAVSCEHNVVQLIAALVGFVHSGREYIIHDMNTPSGLGDIVDCAMASLNDIRVPNCLEGLLLLLNCLPTNYAKYDQVLPLWLVKWSELQNNQYWDCCWSTLFCRARKYSTSFDWVSMGPFLVNKAKQLLHLPTLEAGSHSHSHADYPNSFPGYFVKLIDVNTDHKNVGVMKIAKLLYFLTVFNPALAPAELITVTPPIDTTEGSANGTVLLSGFNTLAPAPVNKSAVDMVSFLQSLRTYIYPSNAGSWSQQLAYFIAAFVFQICRHVGRGVAYAVLGTEGAPKDGSLAPWLLYKKPLHLATVRYLVGSVLSLTMEGLYGKNQVMTQLFSSCLKNLATLDPAVGNVFIPFLLTALDPAAVTQSHQAPIAMQTFTLCFKSLLYPNPVILKYLPTILRLSLPGIDASDATKTTLTLNMYSTILAWIPVSSTYKAPPAAAFPPSYMSLVASSDGAFVDTTRISAAEYQTQWDVLSEYLIEWAPQVLDKMFAVLDAQEAKVKGVRDSPIVSSVGQCAGYFFQAIPVTDPLRAVVEEKLMNYFLKSAPKNASKACAKVMESMISTNPTRLSEVLRQVLTPDILSGHTSHDKLTFRLFLASGACRAAHGANIVQSLPLLEPVLTNAALIHHTEKPVRKAIGKLLRDVLKGSTSFYPYSIQPLFPNSNVVGGPNMGAETQIKWHTPDASTVPSMVHILRVTLDRFVEEIESALASIPTSSGGASVKKVEDLISNHLHVIERIIRGAAELFGDDDVLPVATAVGEQEEEDRETHHDHILSTGRSAVWATLSESDATYLKTVRARLLQFLSSLHDTLVAIPTDSPFHGLKNNSTIVPQWMKVLNLVITRRTASMKDIDNVKKWMTITKRTARSSISKMVYKIFKSREVNPSVKVLPPPANASLTAEWTKALNSKEFWQYHDLSTNTLACGTWLQHGIRVHELSYNAIRVKVPARNNAHIPMMICVRQLVTLCEHEYDVIRQKAHKFYEKLSGRFGYRLSDVIRSLIVSLSAPDTTFFKAMGALQLLKQTRVIKRIMSDWELTELFLAAVSSSQSVISSVEEVDKREKLVAVLSDVFIKYVGGWSHVFLKSDQTTANVFRTALNNVGYSLGASVSGVVSTTGSVNGESLGDAMSVVSDESVNSAVAVTGLRFETFAAYIVLHFIGHRDVEITSSVWQWCVESLCKTHGQPTQNIALSALARLAHISLKKGAEFSSSAQGVAVRSLLSVSGDSAKSQWNGLLHGFSQCRPKNADDGSSAQWSRGIDQILRSAEFLKIALPRSITCILSERNLFSAHFSRENAGIFYSLALSGLLDSPEGGSIFNVASLTALFEYSKVLPSANEAEVRSNNATRAELFAGLMRAFLNASRSAGVALSDSVQHVFLSFLLESTEKISLDFMKDWAEGIFFALNGGISSLSDALPRHILDSFRQLLRSQSAVDAAATAAAVGASNSEEGFTTQGKVLILTKALIQADLVASPLGSGSAVSEVLVAIVNDPLSNIVSPYRTSRIEISSILAVLTELSPVTPPPDLGLMKATLIAACASAKSVAPSVAGDEMQVTSTSSEQSQPAVNSLAPSPLTAVDLETVAADKAAATIVKNSSETACIWLQFLIQRVPVWKFEQELVDLLAVALSGVSSGDIELAKMCHETVVFTCKALKHQGVIASGINTIGRVLALFDSLVNANSSWRVKETTVKCLSIVMVNNWFSLSPDLRKLCKDIYAKGVSDVKPEVQYISKAGMVAYLAYKPLNELKTIAEAYIRNSDALAEREKKKRKAQKDATTSAAYNATEKPDAVYSTTIHMMSCLIMSSPYDLPVYMPNLVSSLVRHITNTALKDTITKTIQMFKMSHQDRWEEYKLKFTREQLEDLQGAGAAHYFS